MAWRGLKLSGGLIGQYPTVFTADSKYFFSSCGPDVKMYSVTTGEQTRLLRGHTGPCVGAAINPDNPLQLYSFGLDSTIRLWDYNDAILLNTLEVANPVFAFAFNPKHKQTVYLATHKRNSAVSSADATKKAKLPPQEAEIVAYSLRAKEAKALFQMPDCSAVQVTPDGEYVVALSTNYFLVYELATGKSYKYQHKSNLTCIAIHPKQQFIATGNAAGELDFWYLFARNPRTGQTQIQEHATTTSSHWHAHGVQCVAFDAEGAHMYSGGKEMVLVVWQLETGHRDFLPRLGAKLRGIVISPDQTLLALRMSDNSIKLINARSRHQEISVEGVTGYAHQTLKTGLIVEPKNNNFAFNAIDGQLQIYNALEDRNIAKLQVGPPNPVKEFLNFTIPESLVEFAAFSKNGDWLATIERRQDGRTPTLKFWSYQPRAQQYELNTQVNSPHLSKISALVYHPELDLCVTTSLDGKFKVWVVVERTEETGHPSAALPDVCWACKSVGFYRDLPARSAAFSPDGSLLAIGYQNVITLWNPQTNTLLTTLSYPPPFEHILFLSFSASSPHLVACSATGLYVWDLLKAKVAWSASLRTKHLAVDPISSRFAIYSDVRTSKDAETHEGYLLIWDTSSPKPLVSWFLPQGVKGIAFLPPSPAAQLKASRISPGVQANSDLVYLNGMHEFIVVEQLVADMASETSPQPVVATVASPTSKKQTPSKQSKRKETEKAVEVNTTPEAPVASTSIATQLRDGFYKQMNSKQLLEGPSVFRQMFGNPEALLTLPSQSAFDTQDQMAIDNGNEEVDNEDDDEPEFKPITGLPKVTSGALSAASATTTGVSNSQAQKKLKQLFDAPSHALPPTSSLFSGFVEALMQTLPPISPANGASGSAGPAKPSSPPPHTDKASKLTPAKPKPASKKDKKNAIFSDAKLLEREAGSNVTFLVDFFAGKDV